jgi:transcriptional regulator with XRE-family HTH domain
MTQRALAQILGRSQRWVSGIEMNDGSPPDDDVLARIAEAIEGDIEHMRTLSGRVQAPPEEPEADAPIQLAARRAERSEVIEDRGLTIPVVRGEQLVASWRRELDLERAFGALPRRAGRRLVASRVTGDGLQPEVLPGDLLIVDIDRDPPPGRLVLAEEQGEAYVKRFGGPDEPAGRATVNDESEVLGVVMQLRRELGPAAPGVTPER